MRRLALILSVVLNISPQAQASVVYNFVQTAFIPSSADEGSIGFVFEDAIIVTDAEIASGLVNRAGNGFSAPSYNLQIGPGGLLSGVINGLLDRYDYRLTGSGGNLSGTLVYGDLFIPECWRPGCIISGGYVAVPEPVSMVAFGAGLLGLAFARRRQTL